VSGSPSLQSGLSSETDRTEKSSATWEVFERVEPNPGVHNPDGGKHKGSVGLLTRETPDQGLLGG
jgi:hypothetical protein